jgi:hypothetical protein
LKAYIEDLLKEVLAGIMQEHARSAGQGRIVVMGAYIQIKLCWEPGGKMLVFSPIFSNESG